MKIDKPKGFLLEVILVESSHANLRSRLFLSPVSNQGLSLSPLCLFCWESVFFFSTGGFIRLRFSSMGGIYPWGVTQLWKMGHLEEGCLASEMIFFWQTNQKTPQLTPCLRVNLFGWIFCAWTVTPIPAIHIWILDDNVIISNTWFGEIWPIPPGKFLIHHAPGLAPRTPIPTYFSKRSPLGSSKRWGIQPPLFLVQDWFATKIMAVQMS